MRRWWQVQPTSHPLPPGPTAALSKCSCEAMCGKISRHDARNIMREIDGDAHGARRSTRRDNRSMFSWKTPAGIDEPYAFPPASSCIKSIYPQYHKISQLHTNTNLLCKVEYTPVCRIFGARRRGRRSRIGMGLANRKKEQPYGIG